MGRHIENIKDRFEAFINKNTESGCWEWTGSKSEGYGQFRINYTTERAHRISWKLYRGSIPKGLMIRHKCRGKCVNPDHLEIGTAKDNAKDKIRDDTHMIGTRHPSAKLTEEQVKDFKRNIPDTEKELYFKTVAKLIGVSWHTLQNIASGLSWRHIP